MEQKSIVMLHTISWNAFLLSAVIGTGLYYLILLVKFRLPGSFYYGKATAVGSLIQQSNEHESPDTITSTKQVAAPALYQLAKDLRTELHALVQTAAQKQLSKEELLIAIQLKTQSYSQLISTPFHAALNNFIEAECAHHGFAPMNAQDLEFIWL